jgi:flavin reductase (DIM6/NTAB) family NADH-FMN oxidoreductase RutF
LPVDPDLFRGTLSYWSSGVTVVTSRRGKDVRGMTASAVCSVSLDPPLVLVCIDKTAIMHDFVEQSRVFALNILARDQEDVSRACATRKVEESRRLEGIPYHDEATGSPILDGAIGFLDCTVEAALPGGDHTIFVGRVEAAGARDGEPLVYFRGAYRRIADD